MPQEAIDALGMRIDVSALANDSVGTLMTRTYTAAAHPPTLVGAILGTGTNAAYAKRLGNITKLSDRGDLNCGRPSDLMIVNTEWGGLGGQAGWLPGTNYDDLLDEASTHPGEQAFEKRVSGLYLAELLRPILQSLWNDDLMATKLDQNSPVFRREGLDSLFLSQLSDIPYAD